MPPIRPSSCVRAARAAATLATTTAPSTTTVAAGGAARLFSSTTRAAGAHGPSYDPPSGWLFGVKPGEKYQNEGWEGPFFYGFCGSLVLFTIAYAFKPDTS